MVLVLGFATLSCSVQLEEPFANTPQNQQPEVQPDQTQQTNQNQLSDGQFPVQQVTYDDATGEYSAILLNTAHGESSNFRATNLPMARLTDAEISQGQSSYLKVDQGQPSLHLTEDFRIEYVHNVEETVTNPQTGQPETIVVQRDTSFWTPFAGALAGQALGSLLFTPHYYLPPVYRPGGVLVGYGGYGRTYDQAVSRYQSRYQAAPAEVRNRQTLRTSGRLRSPRYGQPGLSRRTQPGDRSTGSGYGSSNLRRRDRLTPPRSNRSPGFGSARPRSFGGRRR
ncbi:MAG: hypothetical protein SFY66_01695 [Oculatellaceae cyanobacterium bins.114]|nr:hypothetical protein [Oculatellaceae cyanobacterium bins.114]